MTRFEEMLERPSPLGESDDPIVQVLLDYRGASEDRLRALLISKNVPERDKLEPAVHLAGNLLDWITPIIFEGEGASITIERRTNVVPGSIVIALANHERIGLLLVPPQPAFVEGLIMGAQEMREFIARRGLGVPEVSGATVYQFLQIYGCSPGGAPQCAPEEVARNMLTMLFAVLDDEEIRYTFGLSDRLMQSGFCPAFVTLAAPAGPPGGWAGRWPLLIPLAPYIDPNTANVEMGNA